MGFEVYRSSAGSGKTFTLVKAYLSLALGSEQDKYRKILAITFTNKAASEMKHRILASLALFSDQKILLSNDALFLQLQKELNITSQIIHERSKQLLAQILHNYADFSVSTIDKFTHKIVRTFAHDLRLNVGFEVELDEKDLLQRSVDLLIAKAGTSKLLTRLLIHFIESKIAEDKNWQIELDLLDFSSILLEEQAPDHMARIQGLSSQDFFEIKKQINSEIAEFKNAIQSVGREALELIFKQGIEHKSFAGGANGIGKYFTYLKAFRVDKLAPSATVAKNISSDKWTASSASAEQVDLINSVSDRLRTYFVEVNELIDRKGAYMRIRLLLEKNLLPLALLNLLEKELDGLKQETNIIPISDFNKKISNVVSSEPIPFIYERIGERYHHFLIDEFQDTSLLQWQNMLPLVENALSMGYFNMLVGDGKQAIYRWRGGEVEQFVQLPKVHQPINEELAQQREQNLEYHFKEKLLGNNFRSKSEVVQFNNQFFESIQSILSEGGKKIYKNLQQNYDPNNTGGSAVIQIIEERGEKSFSELTLESILQIVETSIEQGYDYKDIAIICKKNSEGSRIASFLIEHDIPIISSESLLLETADEVRFVISILKLMVDPMNRPVAIKVIEDLVIGEKVKGEVYEHSLMYLESQGDIFHFFKMLGFEMDSEVLLLLPLYEQVEYIMRLFGHMDKANPYLQAFLDVVYGYGNKVNNELIGFLKWWELKKNKFSIKIPEGTMAVSIMTVHKSKGLEFPIVIHPFATYNAKSQKQFDWVDIEEESLEPLKLALLPLSKSLEGTRYEDLYVVEQEKSLLDLLNVLYVALTRPKEKLYILSKKPSKNRTNRSAPDILAHFYEGTKEYEVNSSYMIFGDITSKDQQDKSSEQKNDFILDQFESSDWQERLTISYQSRSLWNDSPNEYSKNYGNLIHDVLSRVKVVEDVSNEIGRMQHVGLLSEEESKTASELIKSILNHPDVSPFFQDDLNVLNEATILTNSGNSYRPDRVVLSKEEATIIDYKTGLRDEKHISQMNRYKSVVRDMGYENVKAYLIYFDQLTQSPVVEVGA